MKSTSAEIYVFSGTGNTFVLADTVASIFNDNNCPTTLHPIPGKFYPAEENCALGLAFTTACFSSYPFVIDFIKNLPTVQNREVFLISSMAGSCLGMPEPFRKLLVEKGYEPIGCCILKMPTNYGKAADAKTPANQTLIKEAASKAANFAGYLLTGKTSWAKSFAPLSSFFFKLAQGSTPWNFFRKMFPLKINQNYCIKCGFCQSICPSGAIERNDNTYLITEKCVGCQHCAAFCPKNAINMTGDHSNSYRAVEYKEIVAKLRN